MKQHRARLVKLGPSGGLSDPAEDLRGRTVIDADGQDIGEVEALYVDEEQRRVRFVALLTGGFLGRGHHRYILPVEAITQIQPETVRIGTTGERVASAPKLDPDALDPRYCDLLYTHFECGPG
jgi:sporulation protein YlmC with PRC-barrel domain